MGQTILSPRQYTIDSGEVAYTGTLNNWTGTTPPSGTSGGFYRFIQVGKNVDLWVWYRYATGGTGITGVELTLPADVPAIFDPSFNSGTSNLVLYPGAANTTAGLTNQGKSAIIRVGVNSYKIAVSSPAQNYANIQIQISYLAA